MEETKAEGAHQACETVQQGHQVQQLPPEAIRRLFGFLILALVVEDVQRHGRIGPPITHLITHRTQHTTRAGAVSGAGSG